MISKTLSTSVCYARLFDEAPDLAEFAQSLYPLLVAHADDFGREQGDVLTVKYRIHPRSPRTQDEFEQAMKALHAVGLIVWYERNGRQCYQIAKFDEHQTGLHKRTRSAFPSVPGNSGNVPESPGQLKGRELNRTERKRTQPKAASGRFERFWELYPRKVAKEDARRAFTKINPDDSLFTAILVAVEQQARSESWRKQSGEFIPYPASWLNGGRWTDEVGASTNGTSGARVVPDAEETRRRYLDDDEVKS